MADGCGGPNDRTPNGRYQFADRRSTIQLFRITFNEQVGVADEFEQRFIASLSSAQIRLKYEKGSGIRSLQTVDPLIRLSSNSADTRSNDDRPEDRGPPDQ